MLTSTDIRAVKFTKSMSGYKQDEVDVLLDKIEADYATFERTIREYQTKIDALNKQIDEFRSSQTSLQNVLISAQKLADSIVDDAKAKSQEIVNNAESNISLITAREKELSTAFEIKAQDRKNALEKELSDMVKTAQLKAESIKAATDDSINRQQLLYDKLKMEVAAFKASVKKKYQEHLTILQSLPDAVPMDPKRISELVSTSIDKSPSPEEYIKQVLSNSEDYSVTKNNVQENATEESDQGGFKVDDLINKEKSDEEK